MKTIIAGVSAAAVSLALAGCDAGPGQMSAAPEDVTAGDGAEMPAGDEPYGSSDISAPGAPGAPISSDNEPPAPGARPPEPKADADY